MIKKQFTKTWIFSAVFAISCPLMAQTVNDGFEGLKLDSGTVMNGKQGEVNYISQFGNPNWSGGNFTLPIFWDTAFGGYWGSGWAISAKIDGKVGASDFGRHLYCAKPGHGSEKTNGKYSGKKFAVGMNGSHISVKIPSTIPTVEIILDHFFIANTTYAFNSMKNGDAFAKKFGGASGNDADSFVLYISSFKLGNLLQRQRIILADYRFADNNKDYILDSWVPVKIVGRDSIVFELKSSDNGQFGMNTPGFFAIDQIGMSSFSAKVDKLSRQIASVFPNPVAEKVSFTTSNPAKTLTIFDAVGMRVKAQSLLLDRNINMDLSQLAPGTYYAEIMTTNGVEFATFLKN